MTRLPWSHGEARTPAERGDRSRELVARVAGRLPEDRGDWPAEWQVAFEERAGIIEFEGRLPRDDAEWAAEQQVRAAFAREVADVAR